MKVLFVTGYPISGTVSTGNTIFNLFEGFADICSFHNICCRRGEVNTDFISSTLMFSDKEVMNSVLKRRAVIPLSAEEEKTVATSQIDEQNNLYKHKETPLVRYIGLFIRDFFWKKGTWKDPVKKYLDELKPDIIFFPSSGKGYHHWLVEYTQKVSSAKLIVFNADDHYTLKHFTFDPIFWLYHIRSRKVMRSTVAVATVQFGITELQCEEYKEAFNMPCYLLTKALDFSESMPTNSEKKDNNLILAYTGNILLNRWKTLRYIGQLLDELALEGYEAELYIYSGNKLRPEMQRAFEKVKSIKFMSSVPASQVQKIQSAADVLVHAEAFDLKNKLVVRQSFSTKLVDYMHSGRCILAAGANDVASIDYIKSYDMGAVLTGNRNEDIEIVKSIFSPQNRNEYARNAWKCGLENHDEQVIHEKLFKAMKGVLSEE